MKYKIGDKVRIINDITGLAGNYKQAIFEIKKVGCLFIEVDTSEFWGCNDWGISIDDIKLVTNDIMKAEIGDIITKDGCFVRILDIVGDNYFVVSNHKDNLEDINSLEEYLNDDEGSFYTKQSFKNAGWKIYRNEEKELEELTLQDICTELGRDIKIIK